jgi:biopolymer transport protein ExbD
MAGGGAKSHNDDGGVISEINVTPLVDITLVLLIIMMVAAPIMANNPSIKVDLPKAATGDETQKSTLALNLTRSPAGGYDLYANGERTDDARLRTMLPELLTKNKDLQVIIASDKTIAYGEVVHVVDLVKALGVHKFALNTDPTP